MDQTQCTARSAQCAVHMPTSAQDVWASGHQAAAGLSNYTGEPRLHDRVKVGGHEFVAQVAVI